MKQDSKRWLQDVINPNLVQLHRLKQIIYSGKTSFQAVEIIKTYSFGKALILDGKIQSSEKDEFIYHEALVHPALITHPSPTTVFIVGGGEGATLREVLAHKSVKKAIMVDIDPEIVKICRQFLPDFHASAYDDPRAEIHYEDARKFLEKSRENFDAIIIDLPEPLKEGPAYLLYTREFYELVRKRLLPRGIVSVQAGTAAWDRCQGFAAINKTLKKVFAAVYPYQVHIPSFVDAWGFVIASQDLDPTQLLPQEVDARISARLSKKLKSYDGLTHQAFFILPKHLRQRLSQARRIITDKKPLFIH